MKVFQIGAAGGIGRRLSELLIARGDEVTGMHRKPDQAATVTRSGARAVVGDLIADSVEELAAKLGGHDAVVFSAGAHGTGTENTTLIDGSGVEKAAAAAQIAGATQFILVSVFPDAERDALPSDGFEHYMRVKKTADVHLASTPLDWVIVRPGVLRDGAGSGCITAGPAVEYGDVHRDNVAAFIDALLHEPRISRTILEVTDGPVPAGAAVAALL